MLKKCSLTNLINRLVAKICVSIQIFAKLPCDRCGISESRNIMKNILTMPHNLLSIGDDGLVDVINSSNKILVKKTNELLNSAFSKDARPKILVVSHQFSLTGAPKAALMLAKSIKTIYGVSPVVMSMSKGPMEEEFLKENFTICYKEDVPIIKEDFINFFNSFDLIIANSYLFIFLEKVKYLKPPVIWWDHEFFARRADFLNTKKVMPYLHSCWAGSPLSLKQLEKLNKKKQLSLVLYGLPEITLPRVERKHQEKIVFVLMGTLIKRKRQDLLINALRIIPPEIRTKAVFYIIGEPANPDNYNYGAEVLKKAQKIKEITVIPEMPFDKLLEFYSQSDVIVSTSDFDPMPIVVTYGLMFQKLCLLSNAIGTAILINDMQNGVLYKSGNAKDLALKITDIIKNYNNYKEISKNGYEIYNKYFSTTVFNKNVEKHIDEALNIKGRHDLYRIEESARKISDSCADSDKVTLF